MRRAAGITMITLGMAWLGIHLSGGAYDLTFHISVTISAVFLVTGGVFCLRRKYWKVCFASALFLFVPLGLWLLALPDALPRLSWLVWFFFPTGFLPIIFVCLGKRKWQKLQG